MSLKLTRRFNLFQVVAGLSLLIVASAVAYYLIIFLPSKEKARQELERAKQDAKNKEQQTYQDCDVEAQEKAKRLLKSKIEVGKKAGKRIPTTWKEASEQGLVLMDDYNALYKSCIRRHGLKY